VNHFKNMSAMPNDNCFRDDRFPDSADGVYIKSLYCPLSIDEVIKVISSMSRHKSSDLTGNVADFFIDCKDFIAPYLVHIFNYIFNTGSYPESWTKGAIVPIFKKGEKNNPSNYRGITLWSI